MLEVVWAALDFESRLSLRFTSKHLASVAPSADEVALFSFFRAVRRLDGCEVLKDLLLGFHAQPRFPGTVNIESQYTSLPTGGAIPAACSGACVSMRCPRYTDHEHTYVLYFTSEGTSFHVVDHCLRDSVYLTRPRGSPDSPWTIVPAALPLCIAVSASFNSDMRFLHAYFPTLFRHPMSVGLP